MAEDQKINQFRKSENFPVASFLIPKHAREPILALYQFARSADEISDDHTLSNDVRKTRLLEIYNGFLSGDINKIPYPARDYYRFALNGTYNIKHGLALLEAFIQDTDKKIYKNWAETLGYCRRSAATIGRHVLEATNEFAADVSLSDNICTVLQLINHLQDLKADYMNDGRCYFDTSFFPDCSEIIAEKESESINKGKLEVISELKEMLNSSKSIVSSISSIRVRCEISVICEVAALLLKKLEVNDILTSRVQLTKPEKIKALLFGIAKAIFVLPKLSRKASSIAFKSRSSFLKPMLRLDKERRRAILCFYSFCRLVDDAADDCTDVEKAVENINFWKDELEKIYSDKVMYLPTHPISRELELHVKKYGVEKKYLEEIIAGQEMDISGQMLRPSNDVFDTYCYRVASCVGLASVKIFGYKEKNSVKIENFAASLGKALQIINIIRDVKEDARKGRIYIPKSLLEEVGHPLVTPEQIYDDYDRFEVELEPALKKLGEIADFNFNRAMKSLPVRERYNMRPALLMKKIYQKYLEKMREYHFIFERDEISLTLKEKFKIFYLDPYEPVRKI